ncbi:Uncharacterised protein [Mycobacteroides abscessus subsp. abscessus]|nr:Uncharacterised protein [Mycobacteroides abscessus subsp. abscessus]
MVVRNTLPRSKILDESNLGPQRHRRHQPEVAALRNRSASVERDTWPDQIASQVRTCQCRRRIGDVHHLGGTSEPHEVSGSGIEAFGLLRVQRMLGFVAAHEMTHDRSDPHGPVGIRFGQVVGEVGPFVHGDAAAVEARVDLGGHGGGSSQTARGVGDQGELAPRRQRDVYVGADRGVERCVVGVQPRRDVRVDTCLAQRERLCDVGDPEFCGARCQRGTRNRLGAVTVAIRFDHGDHVRTGRRADDTHVVGDRVEVDERRQRCGKAGLGSHRRIGRRIM